MPIDQLKEVRAKNVAAFHRDNEPNLPEIDPSIDGLDDTLFAVTLRGFADHPADILDPTIYSIQQSKLRTEEDHRLKLAEAKKEGVRAKIQELRQEFIALSKLNSKEDRVIQVGEDDFNIDPEYFELLEERNLAANEETVKEVAWLEEYHRVRLTKLKAKFYDVLDFEKFSVKAMRTKAYVTTFRVPKMSEFLNKNIEQFKAMMEKELTSKEAMDFEEDEENVEQADNNLQTTFKKGPAQATSQHKSDAERKREERKIEREARRKKIEKLTKKEHMH